MALLPVQLVPPTLADGYCPGSLQEFVTDVISATTIQSSISTDNIVISDTAPTDTTKIWFKTVGGLPSDPNQFYKWHPSYAAWVKAHLSAPGGEETRLFRGTVGGGGTLETYDGGSAGAVGPITGPMWEVDTAFTDRIPIGAGAVVVNTDAGAASVTLTNAELPAHTHLLVANTNEGNNNPVTGTSHIQQDGGVGGGNENYRLTASSTEPTNGVSGITGSATPTAIDTRGPVRGTYFIKRTLREYYVG